MKADACLTYRFYIFKVIIVKSSVGKRERLLDILIDQDRGAVKAVWYTQGSVHVQRGKLAFVCRRRERRCSSRIAVCCEKPSITL